MPRKNPIPQTPNPNPSDNNLVFYLTIFILISLILYHAKM